MNSFKQNIIGALILALSAVPVAVRAECTDSSSGNELLGTLVGAALGGLVGAQVGGGSGKKIAIGAGVLAGGLIGNKVAQSMSCEDQSLHNQAAQDALETAPSGSTSSWRNPDTDNSGSVTPMRTYQKSDGSYCREFEQIISVEGKDEQAYGNACRQADGSWQIVTR